jgi:hypothetical protein
MLFFFFRDPAMSFASSSNGGQGVTIFSFTDFPSGSPLCLLAYQAVLSCPSYLKVVKVFARLLSHNVLKIISFRLTHGLVYVV